MPSSAGMCRGGRCAGGKAEGKRAVGVELTAVCPGAADPPGRQRRQPWQLRDAGEAVPRRRPGHREVAEQPAVGRQIAAAGGDAAVQPRARLNRSGSRFHLVVHATTRSARGAGRRQPAPSGRGHVQPRGVGRSSVPCVRTRPRRCDEFRPDSGHTSYWDRHGRFEGWLRTSCWWERARAALCSRATTGADWNVRGPVLRRLADLPRRPRRRPRGRSMPRPRASGTGRASGAAATWGRRGSSRARDSPMTAPRPEAVEVSGLDGGAWSRACRCRERGCVPEPRRSGDLVAPEHARGQPGRLRLERSRPKPPGHLGLPARAAAPDEPEHFWAGRAGLSASSRPPTTATRGRRATRACGPTGRDRTTRSGSACTSS